MALLLSITMTETPPPVPKRVLREMSREAHRTAGRKWQKEMLPDHFKPGAEQKYGYQERSPKYLAKKRAMFHAGRKSGKLTVSAGGRAPLVFSGLMRDLLKRRQVIKAFPTRATLTMPGPKYVGMKPKAAGRPNLGDEATRTTRDEQQALSEAYGEKLTDLITNHKGRRVNRAR